MNKINVKIKQCYDTEENYRINNPVLLEGQLAYTKDKYGSYKVGDGISCWNDLDYTENIFTGTQKEYEEKNAAGEISPGTIVYITDDNDYCNINIDKEISSTSTNLIENQAVAKALEINETQNNTTIFEEAANRENIKSSEKHSVIFGKIKKWFNDLDNNKNILIHKSVIDLTDTVAYNENTWYPVKGTHLPDTLARLQLTASLDESTGTKPSWSSHANGFYCNIDILDLAHKDGASYGQGIILDDTYKWVNDITKPPAWYNQMVHSSTPVFFVRGGAKYTINTSYICNWEICTEKFIITDESAEPVTIPLPHSYLPSLSGRINSARSIDNYDYEHSTGRITDINFNNENTGFRNKLTYTLASSSCTNGKPPTDAGIITLGWDISKWMGQIALNLNNINTDLYIRGCNGTGVWSNWRTVVCKDTDLKDNPVSSTKSSIDGGVPFAGAVTISSGETSTFLSSARSGFYTTNHHSNGWFNVISNRHRNGCSDGNNFGMAIMSHLTNTTADLIWDRQRTGGWQGQRTILDSVNSINYISKGIRDTNNGSQITASYNKTGMNFDGYTWLTAWNGYELRAVNKNQYMGEKYVNSYWGLAPNGADNIWVRTTNQGIIPYQSGGRGSGHQYLGTESWYFGKSYIDNMYGVNMNLSGTATAPLFKGSLSGTADKAKQLSFTGTGGIESATQANSWYKVGTITITGQYQFGQILGESILVNGCDADEKIYIKWFARAKQQDPLGSRPTYEVLAIDSIGNMPESVLKMVLRTNNSSKTEVELWIRVYGTGYISHYFNIIQCSTNTTLNNNFTLYTENSIGGIDYHNGSAYPKCNSLCYSTKWITHLYTGKASYFYAYSNYGGSNNLMYDYNIYGNYFNFRPGADNVSSLGESGRRWKQLYCGTSTIATSDRREKKEISYIGTNSVYKDTNISIEKFIKFMMGIKSTIYKRIDGNSNRPHHGIIAQDFEVLLNELEIDHAAFIKSPETEKKEIKDDKGNVTSSYDQAIENCNYRYGMRYEELVSDTIFFTQILYNKNKELENNLNKKEKEINDLKERLSLLESQVTLLLNNL